MHLLLCDDQTLTREALAQALDTDPRFRAVAQAGNRAELKDWLALQQPVEVTVLDLSRDSTGLIDGLEQLDLLRLSRPTLPVVVVSAHDEEDIVRAALQAGARGYVTKDYGLHVLHEALMQVSRGHHFLAPRLLEPMLQRQPADTDISWNAGLTSRERDVLQLICAGHRLTDIAAEWGVSVKTVSTHKTRLMEKLGVDNNAALIKLGLRRGLS